MNVYLLLKKSHEHVCVYEGDLGLDYQLISIIANLEHVNNGSIAMAVDN